MLYIMRVKLLTNDDQFRQLEETMRLFNEVCNFISIIAFKTKTTTNKINLQKECYYEVREKYQIASQLVVRAISKVVQAYKKVNLHELTFPSDDVVIFDNKLLALKWGDRVSITTNCGRLELPFMVREYRTEIYGNRVRKMADLILEEDSFYLDITIDLPRDETHSIPINS
ncbi:putative transposase [Paenibacillus sp. LBL]|uniref:hypothetical protein n=1 Tax=Paenibacillus sp. LBL TaxID=2940563 RepID=UPI0024751482|nr:hypothetical protein [Paenibacillus sp. LBL]MDH6675788.1 putative transposase [Paenibacillus sp. LBL]